MTTKASIDSLLKTLQGQVRTITYSKGSGVPVDFDDYLGTEWKTGEYLKGGSGRNLKGNEYPDYPGKAKTRMPKKSLTAFEKLLRIGNSIERQTPAVQKHYREVMEKATKSFTKIQRMAASDTIAKPHWGGKESSTIEGGGKPGMLSIDIDDSPVDLTNKEVRVGLSEKEFKVLSKLSENDVRKLSPDVQKAYKEVMEQFADNPSGKVNAGGMLKESNLGMASSYDKNGNLNEPKGRSGFAGYGNKSTAKQRAAMRGLGLPEGTTAEQYQKSGDVRKNPQTGKARIPSLLGQAPIKNIPPHEFSGHRNARDPYAGQLKGRGQNGTPSRSSAHPSKLLNKNGGPSQFAQKTRGIPRVPSPTTRVDTVVRPGLAMTKADGAIGLGRMHDGTLDRLDSQEFAERHLKGGYTPSKGYVDSTSKGILPSIDSKKNAASLSKEGDRILKEIEPTIAENTARKGAMGTADWRANDGKELPNYRVDDAKAKHKENLKDPLKLSEDRNKFLKKVKKLKGQGGFISPSLLKNIGKIGGITAASVALDYFAPNNPLSASRRRGYKLWEEVGDVFGFEGNIDSNVAGVKNPYMRAGASVGQGLLVDTAMTALGAGGILGDWVSGSKIDSKKGKSIKNRFKKGMLE